MKRLALALLLLLSLIAPASAGGIVSGGTPLSVSLTDSAALAALLGDETGTGAAVFANTPTLVTPILGTPTSGTLTNCTGLPAAGVVGTAAILGANTFTNLQTITQGTANTGILASTGYSLTGSNATNMIDLAGTWNTSGTPTAIKLNITDTASNAASLLMDLQIGGSSKFTVGKAGNIAIPDSQRFNFDGPGGGYAHRKGSTQGGGAIITECGGADIFAVGQNSGVGTVNIGPYSFSTAISATADVFLYRDAAAVLALKNAANAQTLRVYKTTTGPQYLQFDTTGILIKSSGYAFTDGAAAAVGTLTNAPAAGNPTKWIPIDDNGTTRYIPAW